MGLLSWLTSKFRPQPADPELVYVVLPGRIEPIDRGDRFEDPLMDDLARAGLGTVSGGGSQLGPPDEEGRRFVTAAGIDIDTFKVDETRALLRERLPSLRCPEGTQVHYSQGQTRLQDEYSQGGWRLAQPRSQLHPGFGI